MTRHINLLGLLFVFAGALTALVAAALFVLGLAAFTIVWHPVPGTSERAAAVTAVALLTIAGVLLAWAGLNAIAGRGLRNRRPWARLVALALAIVNLFVLPFGTALGVYGLWVLVHHDARREFEPQARVARA